MPAQDAATRRARAGALIRFIRYVRIGKLAPVVPTDAVVSSDVAIPRIHAPHTEQARAASAKRAAARRTAHTPRAARVHGSAVLTCPRLARSMPKPFTHGMRRYNSMYMQPDRKPTPTQTSTPACAPGHLPGTPPPDPSLSAAVMSQGGARRYTPRRASPVSPNKLSEQMARVLSPSRAAASAEDMPMRRQLRVPAPTPICTRSADQAPSTLERTTTAHPACHRSRRRPAHSARRQPPQPTRSRRICSRHRLLDPMAPWTA